MVFKRQIVHKEYFSKVQFLWGRQAGKRAKKRLLKGKKDVEKHNH